MEAALIDKINQYSDRGTLLTLCHIRELAEAVCNEKLGVNWVSSFISRHSQEISSRFWAYQELGRLKASIIETKTAFYNLVSFLDALLLKLTRLQVKGVYDTGLYPPSCIYNLDEAGFEPASSARCVRSVDPTLPSQRRLPDPPQINISLSLLALVRPTHPSPPLSCILALLFKTVGPQSWKRMSRSCHKSL